MEDETAAQNDTATANGHTNDEALEPRQAPTRPAVRYATGEEAKRAGEKVFRVHHRLLAELAK